MDLFDVLEEGLGEAKFYKNSGNNGYRKRITQDNVTPDMLLFATGVFFGQTRPTKGLVEYPEIKKMLDDIAVRYFPDFNYNFVQINKNVRTARHRDTKNIGDTVLFTLGDFKGGDLMTDDGPVDVLRKPFCFNGFHTHHWTGDFTGGPRYCCIYFKHNQSI